MSVQSRVEAAGVPFLARAEWGASVEDWRWNNRTRAEPIPMTFPVSGFFVHHSVTQPTPDPARDMRVVEDIGIDRFGRFSYSYAIHPSTGTIMEGCGDWIGAHTHGRNSTSLAAAAIGNYDNVKPPKALINSYGVLIRALKAEGRLTGDVSIDAHRDVRATGCPGHHLYSALPDIRALAAIDTAQEDDMTPDQEKKIHGRIDGLVDHINKVAELTKYCVWQLEGDDVSATSAGRRPSHRTLMKQLASNPSTSDPQSVDTQAILDAIAKLPADTLAALREQLGVKA